MGTTVSDFRSLTAVLSNLKAEFVRDRPLMNSQYEVVRAERAIAAKAAELKPAALASLRAATAYQFEQFAAADAAIRQAKQAADGRWDRAKLNAERDAIERDFRDAGNNIDRIKSIYDTAVNSGDPARERAAYIAAQSLRMQFQSSQNGYAEANHLSHAALRARDAQDVTDDLAEAVAKGDEAAKKIIAFRSEAQSALDVLGTDGASDIAAQLGRIELSYHADSSNLEKFMTTTVTIADAAPTGAYMPERGKAVSGAKTPEMM